MAPKKKTMKRALEAAAAKDMPELSDAAAAIEGVEKPAPVPVDTPPDMGAPNEMQAQDSKPVFHCDTPAQVRPRPAAGPSFAGPPPEEPDAP